MKQLTDYIEEKLLMFQSQVNERLVVNKNYKGYTPKSFEELKNIINERTKENHSVLYLSDIDVSNVKEFVDLNGFSIFGECYSNKLEYIDVTGWDVSHITNFSELFAWFSHLKEIKGIEDWEISPDAITKRMFHCVPNNVIPEWYKKRNN